ncbi:DNA polymerase Y family protein [Butyrivibrio sp. YAB3001]|uniref:DNA polymerase Y family protein n=1 Tax=Butyrivibrio sp. YAB3001 TaxID=1520812 RepID=UPI0008F68AF0|nr:DNA polymerase IV [Butyrivibrio sp. YAB3001]SFB71102.1 DNA polymerase-4 [Butyrivibrio sp. YAB3001]
MTLGSNNYKNYETIIFHIDVNSAFLSWSAIKMLKDNPGSVDLRTIPSAVGGDVKSRHGIITAKSIPAKKYGIVTGEPVVKALQKCPKLVLVQSDFATYKEYSHAFINVLKKYSPLIEQVSVDEAYVDITGTRNLYKNSETAEFPFPLNIANLIKNEVRDTLGFTVNVGISCNKLLAKMASDFQKPDRIHTLFPEEVPLKMWPLPIGDLFGCGKSTAERLNSLGIRTIGDAAKADLSYLIGLLGENSGYYIHESANGHGSNVISDRYEDAKSYSNETTLSSDLTSDSYDKDIIPILRHLSQSVSRRLKKDHVYGKTVTVCVKTGSFKRHSCQMQLDNSIDDDNLLFKYAKHLTDKLLLGENGLFVKGEVVRLVGVGVTKLDDGSFRQLSLFDPELSVKKDAENTISIERQKKLDKMSEAIDARFGKGSIIKGSSLRKE